MTPDGRNLFDLDCAIEHKRIAAWLDDELALPRTVDGWAFQQGDAACSIEVRDSGTHAIAGNAGLEVNRSRLIAAGESLAVEAFYHLFVLRFISAGG